MILPFTEQEALYEQYDLGESWNGPRNRLQQSPIPYQSCPNYVQAFADETSYVAVRGEGATWTNENALTFSEMLNGTSNTVLVIETHRAGIHWMEPRDYSLDEAIQELSNRDPGGTLHRTKDFFFYHGIEGHNVLMADGSVRFIPIISEEAAEAVLTGRHPFAYEQNEYDNTYGLRYDNIVRLTIFVVLTLLPSYGVVARIRNEWAASKI